MTRPVHKINLLIFFAEDYSGKYYFAEAFCFYFAIAMPKIRVEPKQNAELKCNGDQAEKLSVLAYQLARELIQAEISEFLGEAN